MARSIISIESSPYSPLDPEVNRSKVVKMIICTKLLFSFAKNPCFTKFCQYLNPRYIPTPWNTGRGVVIKDYDSFRLAIVNLFESHKRFSFFFSRLTCGQVRMSWLYWYLHTFSNDHWTLQKRLIAFKMLNHAHSSVNMATLFFEF